MRNRRYIYIWVCSFVQKSTCIRVTLPIVVSVIIIMNAHALRVRTRIQLLKGTYTLYKLSLNLGFYFSKFDLMSVTLNCIRPTQRARTDDATDARRRK